MRLYIYLYILVHIPIDIHWTYLSRQITSVETSQEPASVQHQILTATVKMFLKVPQALAENSLEWLKGKIDQPETMLFFPP